MGNGVRCEYLLEQGSIKLIIENGHTMSEETVAALTDDFRRLLEAPGSGVKFKEWDWN